MRPLFSAWLFSVLASSALLCVSQPAGVIYYSHYDDTAVPRKLTLRAMNPDGTADRLVATTLPEPGFPTWSRDGRQLALTSVAPEKQFALSRDAFAGPGPLGPFAQITSFRDSWTVTTNEVGDREMNDASYGMAFYKAFSPDGKSIAIADYQVTHSSASQVFGWIDPGFESLSSANFATPTLKIYSTTGTLLALVDVARADGITIHAGDGVDWAPNAATIAWSRDVNKLSPLGATLFVTALFLYEPVADARTQGRARQLTDPRLDDGSTWDGGYIVWEMDYQPAFSPDGRQLAYVRSSELMFGANLPTLTSSIHIINVDGTGDREILRFDVNQCVSKLAWAPDGNWIAFDYGPMAVSEIGYPLLMPQLDKTSIYTIRADGTGLFQAHTAPAFWPAWVKGADVVAPALIPQLARQAGGKPQIQLTWPAAEQGLILERTADLVNPAAWESLQMQPAIQGDRATVTLDATAPSAFYRLRRP